jgi:uncharacterized OB-fold protein
VTDTEITDEELLGRFPGLYIDRDTKDHYRGWLDRRLLLNRCQECGYWIYPITPMCPECWSDNVRPAQVSGKGTVFLFTLLHQGANTSGIDFSKPHAIAGIELVERTGLRYLATVVNCAEADIYIGMPVELTWIQRDGQLAPAFQPTKAKAKAASTDGT